MLKFASVTNVENICVKEKTLTYNLFQASDEHENELKSLHEKHKLDLENSVASSKQDLVVKLKDLNVTNAELQVSCYIVFIIS